MFLRLATTLLLGMVLLCLPGRTLAGDACLISVIKPLDIPHYELIHRGFSERLSGSGCRIYLQSPNSDDMSLRNSVRKAVAIGSDLIVTYGTKATLATRFEVHKIPVLFADVYDPVAHGLMSAKGFPLKQVSGIRGDAPVQTLLKAFLETIASKQLAVLFDPADPASSYQAKVLDEIGKRRDFRVMPLELPEGSNPENILGQLPRQTDGLFLAGSGRSLAEQQLIYEFARKFGIPVISQSYGSAEQGCLVSLEVDPIEQGQVLAEMVRQVLQGADPGQLRLVLPKKVALIVNVKVADQLGAKIPFDVLSMVTRVIR